MAEGNVMVAERASTGIAPANTNRYTLDGDAQVESRIEQDQRIIADAVVKKLALPGFCALVLMGGYGRGEGGFQNVGGEPAPYNDYDYFLVVRGMDRSAINGIKPAVASLAHELELQVGVEVDFAILAWETLASAEYCLMFAEMKWGHRVVAGDARVLDIMPSMPCDQLPLAEFTRLMLNRGSLLLLNQRSLQQGAPETPLERETFVKYLFKAILACVDSELANRQMYHPSYPVKLARLEALAEKGMSELLAQYRLAYEARFHPDYGKHIDANLFLWQAQVVQLWLQSFSHLETARLGQKPESWKDYADISVDKGQTGRGMLSRLRNLAITCRDYGLGEAAAHLVWSLRYPRERLISALPLLLTATSSVSASVKRPLAMRGNVSWPAAVESYLSQWKRYA
ncbi:MAG: hypothetical protein R8K46_01640 [Mariprofundaceae bacterium]